MVSRDTFVHRARHSILTITASLHQGVQMGISESWEITSDLNLRSFVVLLKVKHNFVLFKQMQFCILVEQV